MARVPQVLPGMIERLHFQGYFQILLNYSKPTQCMLERGDDKRILHTPSLKSREDIMYADRNPGAWLSISRPVHQMYRC
jgi:hypothetical protein